MMRCDRVGWKKIKVGDIFLESDLEIEFLTVFEKISDSEAMAIDCNNLVGIDEIGEEYEIGDICEWGLYVAPKKLVEMYVA